MYYTVVFSTNFGTRYNIVISYTDSNNINNNNNNTHVNGTNECAVMMLL